MLIVSQTSYSQEDYEEVMAGICEDLYDAPEPIKEYSGISKLTHGVASWCRKNHVADGLDVGIDFGSMGVGLEVKTPVTKWAALRVGVDWMPTFTVPMSFNLNTFAGGVATNNFQKIADRLYNLTGIEMDETVHMNGRGSMVNFKLMVDIYPVPSNRHWHLTAGFFAGTSMVGKALNTREEKPTLVGLNIYNRAYEYFTNLESIFDVPLGGGAYMDPELVMEVQERFERYGRMGVRIGYFDRDIGMDPETGQPIYKKGDPYIMEPAPDGTISARAFVNHFKPYIGAGYATDIDRKGKWHFGVDLGVLFWGGAPDVINHDYVTGKDINFTKDLVNIRGRVGDYMKIIKSFPVFPVLAFKFSYSI